MKDSRSHASDFNVGERTVRRERPNGKIAAMRTYNEG
jgi:hypothetical protein